MDILHCWPGGLFGSKSTIRITGDEYPSPVVDTIIRRPYKVRLATPKFKRRKRRKTVAKNKVEKVETIDWDAIKNIVGDIEDE